MRFSIYQLKPKFQQLLQPLMRAVQVFGFHLATIDLRQSSDKHEEVVAELLATETKRWAEVIAKAGVPKL
eukprot:gene25626-biopygen20920